MVTPPVEEMTTTIATWGCISSTSTCRIVAVSIGGAVTSARRFVTWESCSVVARMASSTSRRMSASSTDLRHHRQARPPPASRPRRSGSRGRWARGRRRCAGARAARSPRAAPARRARWTAPRGCRPGRRSTSSPRAGRATRVPPRPSAAGSSGVGRSPRSYCGGRARAGSRLGRAHSGSELGLGVADDALAALLRLGLDHHDAVALLLDRAGDGDLLLGEAHPAELHGEPPERARVAAGGRHVGARHLGHHVEAVQDVARQAHLLGELGVDVDRVEVSGGARVAVREVLVRR